VAYARAEQESRDPLRDSFSAFSGKHSMATLIPPRLFICVINNRLIKDGNGWAARAPSFFLHTIPEGFTVSVMDRVFHMQ
jgi:hypothetical protein